MLDNEKFLDLYQKEVTEAAHEEQALSHYQDSLEDLKECEQQYNDGMWC